MNMKRKMLRWASTLVLSAVAFAAQAQTVEYIHTDALGTPVAVTDANQNVVERSEYEPYGRLVNRPAADGPGYTGHVSDAATGLSYMQQRYYDAEIGRFLSVDPVSVDGNGGNFARYKYAANNPYRFTDPDGRMDKNSIDRINEEAKAEQRKKLPGRMYEASVKMVDGVRQDLRAVAASAQNPNAPNSDWALLRLGLMFIPPLGAEGRVAATALAEQAPLRNVGAEGIIGQIAQSHADRGVAHLSTYLRPAEQLAVANGSRTSKGMLGHAVHRATNATLQDLYPGRFSYSPTRSFDFIDKSTGQALELTTPGQAASHAHRGADLVFYTLPR